MNYFDHLEEFRIRILRTFLFLSVSFLILWFFREDLLNLYLFQIRDLLKEESGSVILLKITDKFFIHLQTVFFFSIFVTFPWLYLQIWCFIKPALLEIEIKYFYLVFFSSLLLLYMGLFSAYFILIPVGFKFLVSYSVSSSPYFIQSCLPVKLAISLGEQIHLTQMTLIVFAFIFQTPLVVLCLIKMGFIRVETVKNYRRHVIVGCFVASAVFTPPDVISQCVMAIPLIVLFELGLWLNYFINRLSGIQNGTSR